MDFYAILARSIELLQHPGRVAYRALPMQFDRSNDLPTTTQVLVREVG